MEVKAILNRTQTAPQKARLVARLIYGKNVNDAMNILQLTRKKAARIIQKVLKSALANAERIIRFWMWMICLLNGLRLIRE